MKTQFNKPVRLRKTKTYPKTLCLSGEGLPLWFSMHLGGNEIFACSSLEHAFAVSCKHSKQDGYGTWVPCHRNKDGFFMPDIITDYRNTKD